ncbi:MAG: bifunctional oligoribonuclease/PAP phosphatase NrnA [Atribacterota bacterium]|nr:bifunctional oligoribonuclease/PAP phosphatase NrnA [Atribacterota bacterium]MDD5496911.1 bifunctional oligoribonuclease/PAP phosphatase NrnA [Atribacterota bacterium]
MQCEQLSEIAHLFNKYHNFIISSHLNLDGDALGSELALYFMLKQLKKEVRVVNRDKTPYIYEFLPGIDAIVCLDEQQDKNFTLKISPETILVVLDSSNLERIGDISININQLDIINIDHHPSNTNFGHYNYIDTKSSSVGEILFQLGKEMNCPITKQIAIPLYTAIVTDTGSFHYANTRAETFQVAFHLVESGANSHLITNYIYHNNDISGLKLLGKALLKMKVDKESKISWTVVTRDMIEETFAKEEETEGIVDKILSIKEAQVSVLFREIKNGNIKVSLRSKGEFNVDHFSRIFGGGGHPNAAGCQIEGNIKTVTEKVIAKLKEALSN